MLLEQLGKININRNEQKESYIVKEQYQIGSVYLELTDAEKTELLKQLLNELLRQQRISQQQLDTIYKLIDTGKFELATSVDSKIQLYINLLLDDLYSLIGIARPRVLAYYSTCERKIYILVDKALFSSFMQYLVKKIDLKTAYAFYVILTHELTHALAEEKPNLFFTAFKDTLLKWYKTFTTIIDPYNIVFNPASMIVQKLFKTFERYAYKKFCQDLSEAEIMEISNNTAEAWFKPDLLIKQKTAGGLPYYSLDANKIPDGYYREVIYAFVQTLIGIFYQDEKRIMTYSNYLEHAYKQAYSVIGVPHPHTFFHQELIIPSEVIAIAVMYRANYMQQLWQLVPALVH